DGNLYGTTAYGGEYTLGTLFKLAPDGTGFVLLHSFGAEADAQQPMAPMIQGQDGFLYGTTSDGGASAVNGASGYGAVFKIDTNGVSETILHSFLPIGGDGQYPFGGLVQGQDGTLYGVTQQGGSTSNGGSTGFGTVFRLNPDGGGYAVLHNFNPAVDGDGAYPGAGLVIGTDGALYGTADRGGGTNDAGVVFRLNTDGSGYTVLYTFGSTPADGSHPHAPLVLARDGGLFGTAPFGGDQNYGTLFRLAPAPAKIALLSASPGRLPQLSITGAPHFTYRVEASTDHVHWTILTNLATSNGETHFSDPDAPRFPFRFYRAAWVP
ncbi:MAG TPA: choice-of-anchor tandem repeat GloVer-containing protein, partial [Verrucomicrobiae bacterium]|nr:choice-of-anchor tandem repeat GloVer-containing protein [Verrucomicrobiae bacterium]